VVWRVKYGWLGLKRVKLNLAKSLLVLLNRTVSGCGALALRDSESKVLKFYGEQLLNKYYYFVIMNADLNINEILLQVERLDKEDQLSLLEKLALMIRKSERKEKQIKISSISGIGSSLWNNTNIDEYVDQERQW
jgi:hypothetical protein